MNAQPPPDTRKYPFNLFDRTEYPGMVHWFSPAVLLTAGRKVIVSALFGQYADGRLIHASLDPVKDSEIASRCDFAKRLPQGEDGTVWIDYVADLGDGFDPTYAVAFLLAQKSLQVKGVTEALPRGQALIMGGDQVYPEATRPHYRKRMLRPYALAFPDSDVLDAVHPSVFLIPGNHDWYDGLQLFHGMFCRGRPKPIGSWRAIQRRSYFAIMLPDNWWIWGFDSQLGEDIDQPQADYFVSLAKGMQENPKIILCAPVPSWLRAELSAKNEEQRESFYRGLDYIAHIAKSECKNPEIRAVLSGDMHHYSRYSAQAVQFITAGGGGAFLHPTHQLPPSIDIRWLGQDQRISLETDPGPDHSPTPNNPACYPKPGISCGLLVRNLAFPFLNFWFSVSLGAIYWLAAILLAKGTPAAPSGSGLQWATDFARAMPFNPLFWIVFVALVGTLWTNADARTRPGKWFLGIAHAAAHMTAIVSLISILPVVNAQLLPWTNIDQYLRGWFQQGTLSQFALFAAEMILIGGLVAGFIWGIYLALTCAIAGIHDNDAFSAIRVGRYRHFLRLCIKGDELTIYPIGVDRPPGRSGWKWNPARKKNDQNQPEVVPKQPLGQRLIEGPIAILKPKVTAPPGNVTFKPVSVAERVEAFPAAKEAIPPDAQESEIIFRDGCFYGPGGLLLGTKKGPGLFQYGATTIDKFIEETRGEFFDVPPSLLRVMQGVSVNEGKFEAINTWDNSFLSCGIFQWTAGQEGGEGELAALLDGLHTASPSLFNTYFGAHGLNVAMLPDVQGQPRKGHLVLNGWRLDTPEGKQVLRKPIWAYRFWRAAHDRAVRRAQVILAIGRLRLFYRVPQPTLDGEAISDFVTSEYGVALLLDQHVNRPAHVLPTVASAVAAFRERTGKADPDAWNTEDEKALIAIYLELRAKTNMTHSQKRAERMAAHERLSKRRKSFIA